MNPEVHWEQRSFPMTPPGPAEIETVADALLTGFERGPLRTLHAPFFWIRGAVHDRTGALVVSSQRIGGVAGDRVVSSDPVHVDPPSNAEVLRGTWLYGGHWMGQFGHFLTETLSSLWPTPSDEIDGVVFHQFLWGGSRQRWQRRLMRRAGYEPRATRIIGPEPVRVERLLVPTRAFVLNAYALPEAVVPWQRIAASVNVSASRERVYLSRSRYNAASLAAGKTSRSDPERDLALDRIFAASGFAVLHPEELPILAQVKAAAGARVVAGATGSPLHLSVFAPRGTKIIEVADQRSPSRPLPAQQVLDAVCGQTSALIPYALDPTDVGRVLADLGL
jgi:capsular polysaccharide biosynthesis protein